MSDLILYTSEDGVTRLDLQVQHGTVWLTQLEIAELFQITKKNVSLHANKSPMNDTTSLTKAENLLKRLKLIEKTLSNSKNWKMNSKGTTSS